MLLHISSFPEPPRRNGGLWDEESLRPRLLAMNIPNKMVLFSFKVFRGRKCYLFYQLIVVSISEILEDFDKNEWNI